MSTQFSNKKKRRQCEISVLKDDENNIYFGAKKCIYQRSDPTRPTHLQIAQMSQTTTNPIVLTAMLSEYDRQLLCHDLYDEDSAEDETCVSAALGIVTSSPSTLENMFDILKSQYGGYFNEVTHVARFSEPDTNDDASTSLDRDEQKRRRKSTAIVKFYLPDDMLIDTRFPLCDQFLGCDDKGKQFYRAILTVDDDMTLMSLKSIVKRSTGFPGKHIHVSILYLGII